MMQHLGQLTSVVRVVLCDRCQAQERLHAVQADYILG